MCAQAAGTKAMHSYTLGGARKETYFRAQLNKSDQEGQTYYVYYTQRQKPVIGNSHAHKGGSAPTVVCHARARTDARRQK